LGAACQNSGWQVPLLPSLNACFVLVAMNISAPTELKLYKAILAAEHYWLAACHPIPGGPMKLLASTILKS